MEVKRIDWGGYPDAGVSGCSGHLPGLCLCPVKHQGGYSTKHSLDLAQDSSSTRDLSFSTQPNPEINERFPLQRPLDQTSYK